MYHGDLFVFGSGGRYENSIESYNITNNIWTLHEPIPTDHEFT